MHSLYEEDLSTKEFLADAYDMVHKDDVPDQDVCEQCLKDIGKAVLATASFDLEVVENSLSELFCQFGIKFKPSEYKYSPSNFA